MDNKNKKRIADSATHLFYMKGYDGVGVQEICDAAGITKPTLYHYFGSKYGLLEYILNENYGKFFEALKEGFEYKRDLPFNLYKIAKIYFYYACRNKEIYMLVMAMIHSGEQSEAYRAVKPLKVEQHRMITRLFEQSGDVNGNMNGRQEQFAATFMGVINHFVIYWLDTHKENGELIDDEQVFSIVHQFMHGIYA